MKNKRIPIFLSILLGFTIMSVSIAKVALNAKTTAQVVEFEPVNYMDTYTLGDTITISKIKAYEENEELDVYALLQKDLNVLKEYTFQTGDETFYVSENGNYSLIYVTFDTYGYRHTKSYSFLVGDYDKFDVSYSDSYSFSEFVVTDVMAIIDGSKVAANVSVLDPLNKVVNQSNGGFYPSIEGTYTINLSASYDGKSLEKTYTFLAVNNGVSDYFIAKNNIASIDANINSPTYAISGNGVRVVAESADTATFRFKNIIDLNNVSKDENIIKILPLSTENYTLTSEIHVKLIDIYNEKNVVEYFAYPMYYPYYPGMPDWSHCFINYDGRTLARNNDGDGSVRNTYGSAIPTHFNGQMLDGTMRSDVHWIELQVDYPEKQFLCLGYVTNPTQYCILDLDDSNQVGLGKEWNGFTTGEVYLEVSFLADGDNSGVLISEIAGQSFSGNTLNDKTTPSIVIDKYTMTAPNGSVNKPYEVLKPRTVLDVVDGKMNVEDVNISILKRKIYGYYEDVSDLFDGTIFTPNEVGDYIIRYTISDSNGNEGLKDLKLYVGSDTTFETFINMEDKYYVGEVFMLSDVEVNCYTSLKSSEVIYLFNGKKLNKNAYDDVAFYETGTLEIKYKFVAYSGEILEDTKIIEIALNDKPVITSECLNNYVIKGKTLILPNFEAIDYSKEENSSERYPEKHYLINGKKVEYDNKKYVVTQNVGEVIHIQTVSLNATKDFYVTVIEPKYLSDYFIYDNDDVLEINSKNSLEYQFDSDTSFEFINPLIASNGSGLAIDIGLNSSLDTSKTFTITLTDFYNDELSIYVDVTYRSGKYYIKLNGTGQSKEATTYIKNGQAYLNLVLNNISKKITNVFGIEKYDNGKSFAGFTSNLVKIKIDFKNITSKTGFCVYGLAGKSFESYFVDDVLQEYDDISMPTVFYNSSIYDQDIAYGKTITIPSAQAWNVLSGRYDVSVTVKSSSNKNVIYNEDASVTHEVTLNEYGTWYVQYIVVSPSGLRKTYSLAILASNDSIPNYTIDNSLNEKYALGDNVLIPIVKSLEEITVNVTLVDGSGKYIYVEEGSNYKLTTTGIHRLMIYISNGYHYTMEYFEFEVQ